MPRRLTPHNLARLVGVKPARLLVTAHPGGQLPTLYQWTEWQRRRALMADLRTGMSRGEIALKYGINRRQVQWVITKELEFEAAVAAGEVPE